MNSHPLHIVDVFAQEKYTGNQLAVVRDAQQLNSDMMQRIAREMNYSETTFITSPEPTDTGYGVRIFTPQTELPFAGHPTLGTAYVLRETVADDASDNIDLDLDIGSIPVTVEQNDAGHDVYWMEQHPPSFGATIAPDHAADIVSLDAEQVDTRYEPQVVSTGLPALIVPLSSLDAVRAARTNSTPYQALVAEYDAKTVLVFSAETVDPNTELHVRVFGEARGITEDPATGSANGCLAGYLAQYGYFGTDAVDITVEQGYELDRPSLLRLHADATDDDIMVSVGGRVIPIAEGELL